MVNNGKFREKLIKLIDIQGTSSEEVIKVSTELDNMIVKYYQQIHNSTINGLIVA